MFYLTLLFLVTVSVSLLFATGGFFLAGPSYTEAAFHNFASFGLFVTVTHNYLFDYCRPNIKIVI